MLVDIWIREQYMNDSNNEHSWADLIKSCVRFDNHPIVYDSDIEFNFTLLVFDTAPKFNRIETFNCVHKTLTFISTRNFCERVVMSA